MALSILDEIVDSKIDIEGINIIAYNVEIWI